MYVQYTANGENMAKFLLKHTLLAVVYNKSWLYIYVFQRASKDYILFPAPNVFWQGTYNL